MKHNHSHWHFKALKTDFELLLGAAALALIADISWLVRDIIVNAFSLSYALILIGLVISFVITVYILCKRHWYNLKQIRKSLIDEKISRLKYKKHNERKHKPKLNRGN